jgi:hypothetical protein
LLSFDCLVDEFLVTRLGVPWKESLDCSVVGGAAALRAVRRVAGMVAVMFEKMPGAVSVFFRAMR